MKPFQFNLLISFGAFPCIAWRPFKTPLLKFEEEKNGDCVKSNGWVLSGSPSNESWADSDVPKCIIIYNLILQDLYITEIPFVLYVNISCIS